MLQEMSASGWVGGIDAAGLPEFLHGLARDRPGMEGDHIALAADARRLALDEEDIGGLSPSKASRMSWVRAEFMGVRGAGCRAA